MDLIEIFAVKIFGSIERERIPNAQEECTHFHWFSYVTISWLIGKLNHCNNKLLTVSLRVWALHAQIKKKNRKVSIQNQIVFGYGHYTWESYMKLTGEILVWPAICTDPRNRLKSLESATTREIQKHSI